MPEVVCTGQATITDLYDTMPLMLEASGGRALSFTSTDGVLDSGQTDIVLTASVGAGVSKPTYVWTFVGFQTAPAASTTASQTVTSAQFGTSRSATVTCTVGGYTQTLTIVRLEKSTAAAGATVGATWGSNIRSVPSNISTAGSTPTVDIRNNQIGLNASGQLYGAGAGNGTTVSNAQISVDTDTGVIGGIGTGAGTAVANSQVAFSARQTWEFRGSAEGWVAGGDGTITASADTITLTSSGIDPTLSLGGLSINGAVYDKLRMRVRRVAGSGWDGRVYFATSPTSPNTHNFSESYRKGVSSSPISTSFVILEWDMANLSAGGNNWTASTITAIRFDLGFTSSDVFEIDWISVGKYGHDVDLVLSSASQIIAGSEADGVVLDAASKSLQVRAGGNERVRLGNLPTAVNGSNYGMVVKDTSGNTVFDSRNGAGIVGNPAQDNYNLGDSTTNPLWNGNTGGTNNIAIGARALQREGLTLPTDPNLMRYSIAIGTDALRYATAGENVGVGFVALRGTAAGFSGTCNVALGYYAMQAVTAASYNVAVGGRSLSRATTASGNVALGYTAMHQSSTAVDAVAVGRGALIASNGTGNVGVGKRTGAALTTGNENTLLGADAGALLTTGSGNTYIGTKAGNTLTATSENTVVITSGAGTALVIDSNALAKIYGNKVWHEGSDGTGSGLDADLLDGYQPAITATASTVATRDLNGDLQARTLRSEVADQVGIDGALAFRTESTAGGDNGLRFCSDKAALKTYLGVVEREAFGRYYPSTSGRNIDDVSAGDVGLYSKTNPGTWPTGLVSGFAWVETQSMYTGNAVTQRAVEYTSSGTPTGEQWFRTRSNSPAPYVWSAWRRVLTDGNCKSVLPSPVSGAWFNGGYVSISSGGVAEVGRYVDWHYASTDTTDFTSRTEIDPSGNLTHSAGLKVKGTSGLGYAFGGAVTQLTSRDTGVTLDTPSGTITLATVATTSGTLNKFTLTNSCIQDTDVVTVCMRNSGTGRYNVFVDRVVAGACDIRLQNQATTVSEACSLNFAIIKGANA